MPGLGVGGAILAKELAPGVVALENVWAGVGGPDGTPQEPTAVAAILCQLGGMTWDDCDLRGKICGHDLSAGAAATTGNAKNEERDEADQDDIAHEANEDDVEAITRPKDRDEERSGPKKGQKRRCCTGEQEPNQSDGAPNSHGERKCLTGSHKRLSYAYGWDMACGGLGDDA